ncbi:MAG: ATP-binding cassette domain-containing protein [Pseudomonadales bacterium]|jgi:ATP-binding cassette subfamily F protein uup|nr:ATP-binding cassette domain-containing protein [Pseudomonadales bacterium]
MPLFRLNDIQLSYGTQVLLDKVSFTLHSGERWGLLGRNGAGKSTFLKLLSGAVKPDGGEFWREPDLRVAYLDQELPEANDTTVFDYVADGLNEAAALIKTFHQLTEQEPTDTVLRQLETVQREIDAKGGWSLQQRVESIISTLELPAHKRMRELSGGWARRVALGRALVNDPDVLLLDEPTNHLDIPAIGWLEKQLQNYRGAVVVITHDRSFLQQVANRILELDRGKLRIWQYDYRRFLEFRDQQLEAEAKANMEFDKRLAQEEVWIRQGIKARRTRNEGRVRALKAMREEFKNRRELQGNASMQLNTSAQSGKLVLEVENISQRFGERELIRNFSTVVQRGDKIGLLGPNGGGKSTLLKILLGQLTPDSGTVKQGTKIELAYFDQLRAGLDPEKSVRDNLAEASDYVEINGKPRHVISYLQDFLFTPDRLRQPVKALSGGEQNRLILARLFSKPANLLVLDEPTNDLDLETLELLEELLLDFPGTLLLVSHDREFLDNVVQSCIVFEGKGKVKRYVGGYRDWLAQGGHFEDETKPEPKAAAKMETAPKPARAQKLSYKQQRELEQIPKDIEAAEQRIAALEAQVADPAFYQKSHAETEPVFTALRREQERLETLFERWQELEAG